MQTLRTLLVDDAAHGTREYALLVGTLTLGAILTLALWLTGWLKTNAHA